MSEIGIDVANIKIKEMLIKLVLKFSVEPPIGQYIFLNLEQNQKLKVAWFWQVKMNQMRTPYRSEIGSSKNVFKNSFSNKNMLFWLKYIK